MSSVAIPPAPPPAPAPTTAAPPAVLTVAAGSDAQALAALPTGSVVTVSTQAMEGKALLAMTADGASLDLKLPPNLQLPPGADLTLQLIQQNGLPAFKLLAVNGRPFPPGPLSAGGPLGGGLPLPGAGDPLLAPGAPGLGAPTTGRGAAVTLGAPMGQTVTGGALVAGPLAGGPLGLTATVVRPAPAGAAMTGAGADGQPHGQQAPPAGFANLPPGTQLTVRIAGITSPGATTTPAQTAAGAALATQPQAGLPPPGGSALPQAQTATTDPNQARPGTTPPGAPLPSSSPSPSSAPPSGAAPPGTPATPQQATAPAGTAVPPPATPPPSSSPPTVTLPGTVTAHSPGGTSLLQTPAGLLSLPAGPPMAVGDTVRLEVVRPPVPPPPPTTQPEQQGLGPNGWPTLSSAADVLAQSDRQMADQLIRMIPQANPRLAAAMSLFAGAVRAGDFKQLGGDGVIKGLDKAGRRDLADRLKRDFLDLADEAQRPRGDGEWQVVTLPFAHGADIDPIHLYVHRPGDDEDKDGGGGQDQHFILDVRMSQLGRIQFDGLVQRDNKRFDLIVRTAEPLGTEICRDIAGIFAECGQLTGVKGSVGFQSGRSFVELPPCDAKGTQIVV